ncbi:cytochrome c oxidase assembly protein [Legionella nagasakiensis]|uniref:cytochrome c oxidase assembly protein n=1 Tax=Legionella nagasakiensis TaxID=535290 RepID=UPI001055638E|nr:cytochrome c oxidase assembly protein [Legionella nagasakiensis]
MNKEVSILCLICLSAIIPSWAFAHDPFAPADGQSQLPAMISAVLLLLIWMLYMLGSWRFWPGFKRCFLFQLAVLIMIGTIFGPLDEWAETNTAAHMTQHMSMMVVITPLWVLSQPLPQLSIASGRLAVWFFLPFFRLLHYPMLAAALHAVMIWFWHAPKPYLLALENPWWHVVEHACFIVTAGLFWWAVMRSTLYTAAKSFLALLFTLMHTGFLGALLTFSHISLYGHHRSLQSQQLAGLIMWVAGSIPYLLAVFWCGQRWFKQTPK